MFSKLSILAVAVPFVSALTLDAPSNPTSGGQVTIKWTAQAGDPQTFDLQLTNDAFHNTFAIANTVQTGQNQITLELPDLQPGDGYAIIAHDPADISKVFAQTGDFSVGAQTSSSSSSATTASASGPKSAQAGSTLASITTPSSGFGTTVRNTATSAASGAASGGQSAAAASSSAPSGASSVKFSFSAASISAVVFSMVAGAAFIAL